MNRTGDWICTRSGVKWFVTDPHSADVRIEDIAYALSNICRYGGHCMRFYSVAQHSVEVAGEVVRAYPDRPRLQLHALLHDAAEAYIGDMVRPLKQAMPAFKDLEVKTEAAIVLGLDLPFPTNEERAIIKHFDDVLLMTERRDLVNHGNIEWTPSAEPLECTITPIASEAAAYNFLTMFAHLRAKVDQEKESEVTA